MAHGSWQERKAIAAALNVIYQAENAEVAEVALDEFAEGPRGQKYPTFVQRWRKHWSQVKTEFSIRFEDRFIMERG
jgi:putative transposase